MFTSAAFKNHARDYIAAPVSTHAADYTNASIKDENPSFKEGEQRNLIQTV